MLQFDITYYLCGYVVKAFILLDIIKRAHRRRVSFWEISSKTRAEISSMYNYVDYVYSAELITNLSASLSVNMQSNSYDISI